MVEMEADLGMLPAEFLGIGNSTLSHIAEKGSVGIVACALGNLKNYRRLLFGSCFDDGLKLLHVVEVESGHCISALHGLGKHLAGVDQT